METLQSPDALTQTLHLVQRLHWQYDDSFYEVGSDEPIRAFVDHDAAESYCRALEHNARNDQTEARDQDGIALLPREDPEFDYPFFEVVPIRWHK